VSADQETSCPSTGSELSAYREDPVSAVNLVDQASFKELSTGGRRVDLKVLAVAASSPMRTASATSQLRNVTASTGAASSGWWVSTNSGPLPRATVGPATVVGGLAPPVPTAQDGTGGLDVLVDKAVAVLGPLSSSPSRGPGRSSTNRLGRALPPGWFGACI